MAHAHCMLDDKGYKHSLRIRLCSSYCFATTTIDARTRTKRYVIRTLSVMLCLLYSKVTDWPRRTVADFRLCVGHDCLGAHLHHIAIRPDPYCTLCRLHEPMDRSLGSVVSRTQLSLRCNFSDYVLRNSYMFRPMVAIFRLSWEYLRATVSYIARIM